MNAHQGKRHPITSPSNDRVSLEHSVAVPAEHFVKRSVNYCATLAGLRALVIVAIVTLGYLAFSTNVGPFLVCVAVACFGINRVPVKFYQNGIYHELTQTVLVDCRTTQSWNRLPVLSAILRWSSIVAPVFLVLLSIMAGKFGMEIAVALVCLGVRFNYFHAIRSSDKLFRKFLEAGTVEPDGVHFTVDFVAGIKGRLSNIAAPPPKLTRSE